MKIIPFDLPKDEEQGTHVTPKTDILCKEVFLLVEFVKKHILPQIALIIPQIEEILGVEIMVYEEMVEPFIQCDLTTENNDLSHQEIINKAVEIIRETFNGSPPH